MEYGLIAEHLGHSFSKTIHDMIGNYDYTLKEIEKDSLADFLKSKNFKGLNVTIPYKTSVIPYLDELDSIAKEIGAVNTIVNKNGKLYGYNTDFFGMTALIKKQGFDFNGKKVLILGSGGTSKTAFAVSNHLGAKEIFIVSRKNETGKITYEDVAINHNDADFIINTTPKGMFPNINECPIDLDGFKSLNGVIDAIFNPLSSNLVLNAKKTGISSIGGLYMLVTQAVCASELFFDKKYEPNLADKIYDKLLNEKTNIVLIGMPSSGKTTIGRKLAKILNREFIDTDELIKKESSLFPGEIIKTYGEEYFRDLESKVISEISTKNNTVISTGGGAILRDKNIQNLKLNGTIIFLNRKLEDLTLTSNRPLSNTPDKLKKLYDTRFPIYYSSSDFVIDVKDDFSQSVAEINHKIFGGSDNENSCN